MKLICNKKHELEFQQLLFPYQHLDITLIEKGLETDSIGIYFDYQSLNELIAFLEKNFIKNENNSSLANYTVQNEPLNTLIGIINENHYIIQLKDIIYIEGLNKDTFMYTKDNYYRINYRLYVLEEQLFPKSFIRISKSIIINILKIQVITPAINGRLLLLMENNVQLEVSRIYASNFKKNIGM